MKEIKDDIKQQKDSPCSWTGRTNIVLMSILPRAIYRLDAIHIKIPTPFFIEEERICIEPPKTLNSQDHLGMEEQSWRYHNPRFQDTL